MIIIPYTKLMITIFSLINLKMRLKSNQKCTGGIESAEQTNHSSCDFLLKFNPDSDISVDQTGLKTRRVELKYSVYSVCTVYPLF